MPLPRYNPQVKNLRSYLPILDIVRFYERDDFNHDVVAGVIVGVITIPQAVAYAFLAGLPAEAGLYACIAPLAVYALLGSSRQLVVGPVAVAALMVAATVSRHAPAYSDAYLSITGVVCLQAGLFLLVLRASNMGGIVNLLSHPVVSGFINAAALMIIVAQVGAFTGIDAERGGRALDNVFKLAGAAAGISWTTTAVGVISVVSLLVLHRVLVPAANRLGADLPRNHPIGHLGPMVVTVVAVVVFALTSLADDVATVGQVPSGLPRLTLPPFNLPLWLDLAPPSALIALVAYVGSFSIGSTLASRQRQRVNGNQELIALGAANLAAAFTGAAAVAGSFSRSSVNYQAGARSPVASLVSMVVVILTLLFFAPLFQYLPEAVLAAIIIVSVSGLVDIKSLQRYYRFYPWDALTHVATMIAVLLFDVETGLMTGVVLSIVFFVRRSSRPHIAIVGRVGDSEQFRNVKRYDVETFPHVAAVRVDENLFFANANQVENKLLKVIQRRPETRHVLLVCSAINMIDTSGLEMLERVNETFRSLGIKLHLSDVKGPVMEQLEASPFTSQLSGSVFFNAGLAMRDLTQRDDAAGQVRDDGATQVRDDGAKQVRDNVVDPGTGT